MAQAQFLPCRRYAARLGVFLALALLVAQTGAVMHQSSHLSASGKSRGVPATSSQSCPACQSYAPVLAAAGGTGRSPSFGRAQIGTTYRTLVAPLGGDSPQHAFLSRAPPLLAGPMTIAGGRDCSAASRVIDGHWRGDPWRSSLLLQRQSYLAVWC